MAEPNILSTAKLKHSTKVEWQYYPRSKKATPLAEAVVAAFEREATSISSVSFEHNSNKVLEAIREHLIEIGFDVESGKQKGQKVCVPVLFGRGGVPEKSFDADAYHRRSGF